jgi:hypothetical protein
MQRIGGSKPRVMFLKSTVIEKQRQAGPGADAIMMIALGADLQVIFESFSPNNLPAMLALLPKTLRANASSALFRIQGRFVASEPSHGNSSLTHAGAAPGGGSHPSGRAQDLNGFSLIAAIDSKILLVGGYDSVFRVALAHGTYAEYIRRNAASAKTASQLRSGSVSFRATCFAHA